jgi:hypothetical protein
VAKQIVDLGKPDPRGNFRLFLAGQRFYLGSNSLEAQRRALALQKLWACVEARWQREHDTEKPEWDPVAKAIGLALARGATETEIPCPVSPSKLLNALAWLRNWEADYPLIALRLPADVAAAVDEGREQIRRARAHRERCEALTRKEDAELSHLLAEPSSDVQVALDAYAAHVKEKFSRDGQVSEYGVVTLKYVRMLKASISGPGATGRQQAGLLLAVHGMRVTNVETNLGTRTCQPNASPWNGRRLRAKASGLRDSFSSGEFLHQFRPDLTPKFRRGHILRHCH